MEGSEKLTALKKAYADVILNTAKEAAARIKASEKKAMRIQRELSTTKEEALRMLLRLKQILDSKVREAEITSMTQQRKIEELEAQLGEAEDIVRDLRAELQVVRDEVDKAAIYKNLPDDTSQEIGSSSPIFSLPGLLKEPISTSNKCNNGRNDFRMNYSCVHSNPDFATIVRRSKESELCRNGCTQRISAFKGNRIFIRGDEEGEEKNTEMDEKVIHKRPKFSSQTTEITPPSEEALDLAKREKGFLKACSSSNLKEDDDMRSKKDSESHSQSLNNARFLGYTFQRKRKKDPLSSPEGNNSSSLDECTFERKTGKKNSTGPLLSEMSNLVPESSRDSRRLAQVARQLVSLSAKKRWG